MGHEDVVARDPDIVQHTNPTCPPGRVAPMACIIDSWVPTAPTLIDSTSFPSRGRAAAGELTDKPRSRCPELNGTVKQERPSATLFRGGPKPPVSPPDRPARHGATGTKAERAGQADQPHAGPPRRSSKINYVPGVAHSIDAGHVHVLYGSAVGLSTTGSQIRLGTLT